MAFTDIALPTVTPKAKTLSAQLNANLLSLTYQGQGTVFVWAFVYVLGQTIVRYISTPRSIDLPGQVDPTTVSMSLVMNMPMVSQPPIGVTMSCTVIVSMSSDVNDQSQWLIRATESTAFRTVLF